MEPSHTLKVRARAADLQTRIGAALRRASPHDGCPGSLHSFHAQKLRAIRSALLHLQGQLDSLQTLQKRQKFEKEHLLVALEEKRNLLIKRLREYKGTEWQIVEEAHAFLGEPVQREGNFMLRPRPSGVRDAHTPGEDGSTGCPLSRQQESRNSVEREKQKQSQEMVASEKTSSNSAGSSGFVSGLVRLASEAGHVLRISAKSVFVMASIMFTLSWLELQLRKQLLDRSSNREFHIYGCARRSKRLSSSLEFDRFSMQDKLCPHGKVLLRQDGFEKCLIKERTEAPFKEDIRQPDASYGFG